MDEVDIDTFEKYVAAESRPLMPVRCTVPEIEFLAIANAFGGEAGELQDAVKKILRSDQFYSDQVAPVWVDFLHEAGDVLHYLVRILILTGFTLEDVMTANIEKLEARKLLFTNAKQTSSVAEASAEFGA